MKKKSIFISIVLALVMCLASLVACGEDVDNAGGGDDDPRARANHAGTYAGTYAGACGYL